MYFLVNSITITSSIITINNGITRLTFLYANVLESTLQLKRV